MEQPEPRVSERRTASLTGLMVDMVTPLRPDRSLDLYALEGLLLHIMAAPVTGICPVATVGEGPLLPLELREEATRAVAGHVGSSVQVMPLAVGTSVSAVTFEVGRLAAAGATAILTSPLSFYPETASSIYDFYHRLAEDAPVPLVLYHSPGRTGIRVPVEVVAGLALAGAIAGIHDASGEVDYLTDVVTRTEGISGFAVVGANDAILTSSVLNGAAGVVSAGANLVPRLAAQAYESAVVRTLHSARLAQRRLLAIVNAVHARGFPYGWKAAVHAAGLCGETSAGDGYRLDAAGVRQLTAELASLGAVPEPG